MVSGERSSTSIGPSLAGTVPAYPLATRNRGEMAVHSEDIPRIGPTLRDPAESGWLARGRGLLSPSDSVGVEAPGRLKQRETTMRAATAGIIRRVRLLSLLGTLSLAAGIASADEPKAGKKVELKPVFDEDFKTFALPRFKQVTPGQVDADVVAGTTTLSPGVVWVRPAQAGYRAKFQLKLAFPALAKDGDVSQSDLGFVLSSQHLAVVRLARERKDGKVRGTVTVLKAQPDPAAPGGKREVLPREVPLTGDLADGEWSIQYHHGLVVVARAGTEVARGYLETPGAAVIGINWDQAQATLTCGGMRLDGLPVPAQPKEAQTELQKAARLNQEGMRHYASGEFAEALGPTAAASEIYRKVLGDEHHDTANSYANLATLSVKLGKLAEAQALYERALKARGGAIGTDHPHTGLLQLELGNLMAQQGKAAEARTHYAEALKTYEPAYGPAAKPVEQLRRMIGTLDKK